MKVGDSLVRVRFIVLNIYDYSQGVKREVQRTSAGGLSNSTFKDWGKEKKMTERSRSSG